MVMDLLGDNLEIILKKYGRPGLSLVTVVNIAL